MMNSVRRMVCLGLAFGALGLFYSHSQAQYIACTAVMASCSSVTTCCYNAGGFQTGVAPAAGQPSNSKLTIGGSPTCGVDFTGPFGFCVSPSAKACGTPQYDPDCT